MTTADTLWEIEQIKQLKARYFRLLDTKQWAAWRDLFTDDFHQYRDSPTTPGEKELAHTSADAWVADIIQRHTLSTTTHHGHMPEIELTGPDTATGIWAMFDWVDNASRNRAIQGYGHYFEEYRKGADGRWRISSMWLSRLRVDGLTPTAEVSRTGPPR